MQIFPHFPLHLNSISLFGLTLVFGLLGGEIVSRYSSFLPRITGYMLIGFLIGPGGFNFIDQNLIINFRFFVDISLSLILFDLGRHLDFTWLRHDKSLLLMSFVESALTFGAVFIFLVILGMPLLSSALAATIAIATGPAVLMMVVHDLSSEGPVTRRALILTSLNNIIALSIFTLLLPFTQTENMPGYALIMHSLYRLFGSIALGYIMFVLAKNIAILVGKEERNQFVLFIGIVMLTIGLAKILTLPTMVTLFILGVCARNFDQKHALMEVDFGWLARLFFILLFVVTGIRLQLQGLWEVTSMVVIFLVIRAGAKMSSIWMFTKISHLTKKQSFALSLTLLPMAGVALGMSTTLIDFSPELGNKLLIVITSVIAILNILGPIITQYAFMMTGEGLSPTVKMENI